MGDIRLSDNFWLGEFTRSQTAARLGREIEVAPDGPVFRALQRLCLEVLQSVREALGPVFITSGYRPEWLNTHIGGSSRSQHMAGQAADLVVSGHSPHEICEFIERTGLPFDQLIHEFGRWVHVSVAPEGREPRREVLTAYKRDGRTAYAAGLHAIEDLQAVA